MPIHARCARLIRPANDVDALILSSCDPIISPMHEHEASPACASSVDRTGWAQHVYQPPTLPWGGVLLNYLSLTPSRSIATIPHTPNVFCHGSLSAGRYLSNPSEALLQVVDCGSFRLAWAKGLAARTPSSSVTHPTLAHSSWGCFMSLSL